MVVTGIPLPPLSVWNVALWRCGGEPVPPVGTTPFGSKGLLRLVINLNSCLGLPRARTTWTGA